MVARNHTELEVWKNGIDFVEKIYSISSRFPKEEVYGLTSQLLRASVSIPANVAEGAARNTDKEFIQFLHIALGSTAEVETHLTIAQRLKFVDDARSILDDLGKIRRQLSGLIRHYKHKGQVDA